jgi:cytoskeletal protein RodZ
VQSIGERLKKTREKQGVTLDEVCVNTKVAVRFLEAIEADKFEKLPGGIFNKGFIRAYAQHLGINDDEAVADYLQAAGLQPTIPLNTTPPGEEPVKFVEPEESEARIIAIKAPEPKLKPEIRPEIKKKEEKKPEPKPVAVVAPVPLPVKKPAAMIEVRPPRNKNRAARAQARQEIRDKEKEKEKKKAVQPLRVAPPTLAPAVSDEHWFPWGKVAFALLLIAFGFAMWGSFHREVEDRISRPAPLPVTSQQSVSPAPAESAPASSPDASTATPTPDPAANSQGSFQVVVQAHADSWISIVADGKEIVAKEVLGAPAQKAIEAHKEVVITASNIGALDFVFNGKKLPSQGGNDEVKTLTFDSNGLQVQPVKTAGL